MQYRVEVTQGGQVAGGVEQRCEFGFAAALAMEHLPDPEGGGDGPVDLLQFVVVDAVGAGARGHRR